MSSIIKCNDQPLESPRDIATNAAKLLSENLVAGDEVLVTSEGNRLERYHPTGTSLKVTTVTADTRGVVGDYKVTSYINGKPFYHAAAISRTISWNGTKWQIKHPAGIYFESSEDVATPDLVTTWTHLGIAPLPIVEKSTGETEWIDVVGSYELSVFNDLTTAVEVNGVNCLSNATTYVGWVNEHEPIYWTSSANYFMRATVVELFGNTIKPYFVTSTPSNADRKGLLLPLLPQGKLREVKIKLGL